MMRSNTHDLLIRLSSDIKALKALSIMIPDTIDQETTVTSEEISSLLKCVVESMKNSQESLIIALQETA